MRKALQITQIILSIWVIYIFLGSLPYKFTSHEHTQFIFGTIGDWMKSFLGNGFGEMFGNYAAYVIGFKELIVSIILIVAINFTATKKPKKASLFYFLGGVGAMLLMIGATFFHLFTPLGIDVNGDGGSLFRAAVSIVLIGSFLTIYNRSVFFTKQK